MCEKMPLQGLSNTRDLGGILTADGHHIQKNRLIRSGQLYSASQEDLETLRNCGLRQIIDLRTEAERREKPDPILEGVRYIPLPVLTEATQGITREQQTDDTSMGDILQGLSKDPRLAVQYMTGIYTDFVKNAQVLSQYAAFLDLLLENQTGATLWHCTAGKDRAGFAAILVLETLGVDRETILQDYLYTNECLEPEIRLMIAGLNQSQNSPALEQVIRAFFGAKQEYIDVLYRTAEAEYGSFRTFLRDALGMNDEKIAAMQALYLQ
jgi:protein-tyrosine phosphatase